jgi:hypothetical protein
MTDADLVATQATVTAAALHGGHAIDAWSLALVLAAVGAMLWTMESRTASSTGCLAACIIAGLAQRYYAARVGFDAALFNRWAQQIGGPADAGFSLESLAAIDRALVNLGLHKNHEGATRDLAARSRGALRLLGRQALCLLVQFAALLSALMS